MRANPNVNTVGGGGGGGGGGDTITSPNSTLTVGGTAAATTLDVANIVTFNNSGSGAASGTTYNGSAARTISYNTIGAAPAAVPCFYGYTCCANGSSWDEYHAISYDCLCSGKRVLGDSVGC